MTQRIRADWPGRYGTLTAPESEAAIEKRNHFIPIALLKQEKFGVSCNSPFGGYFRSLVVLALFILALLRVNSQQN
jgi:hypothetical protein